MNSTNFNRTLRRIGATVLLAGALGACVTQGGTQSAEGIGYRQARFTEMAAMRGWRSCRDEAMQLDAQARTAGDAARYLASARLLENCETELGPEVRHLAAEERMRAYATAVQNHFKGGDVAKARETLEAYRTHFTDRDLYLADGSSFTTTMELLLGIKDRTSISEFSMANAPASLKNELRRARYWERH
jgi:hypothetical protein